MATFGPVLQTPDEEIEVEEIDIEVPEEGLEIEIDFDPEDEEGPAFGENLADTLDDSKRAEISLQVLENFDNDVQSREDWAKSYVKGLDLLGIKVEDRTQPWEGAAGVFHPVLTESIIRFQAQAMGELFPAAGPARTKMLGKATPEKMAQATRIETEMNYLMTEKMDGYRDEMEQHLFHLPLAGSAFKKVFYDPVMECPCSMFVPAEDLVVSYGATSLMTADRYTHVMRKTREEIEELIDVGFYSDIDLGDPDPWRTDIQEKYDELSGEEHSYSDDTRFTVLEQHMMLRLNDDDPLASPYVATVDKSSGELLSLRANWREKDSKKRRRMHFVHYKYLPGLGFYGIGLIHLLGGLTKTATSVLRQLIDAGTLANLPAGFKTRGLRIKGDNTPFRPGEFRDVDVPGGKIQEAIHFLPFKEPSATLYQLLGNVVDEARRIGAVAETELTQFNKEMPVGTAFAILERQMKVMSGVQARMHDAFRKELRLVSHIIHDYMDGEYEWNDDEETKYKRKDDFDGRVDVIPVTDPNAATVAQRVVAHQAAMQMSQQAPQLYNMGKLHRQMLDILKIDNASEIVKLPEDIKPMDPVTENMAILKQEPVKAFMHQDHESHIRVHMAAAQDPKLAQIVGQSPFAEAIQASLAAHIQEHVAYAYRAELEKQLGVPMPGPEEELPEDAEVELSRLAAAAADKLLGKNQAEMAQQEAQQRAQDPLVQMQERELALKESMAEHEKQIDLMKMELEAFKHGSNMGHQRERLNSEEMRAAVTAAIKLATEPKADDKMTVEAVRLAKELNEASKDKPTGDQGGE